MRIDGAKTLNPGLLRDILQLQERVVSGQDSYGADQYEWVTVQEFRGQVTAMQGRELEAARQTWAEARFKVRTHYMPEVEFRRDRRLLWGTRALDIGDAEDPYGTRRVLWILTKEIVS